MAPGRVVCGGGGGGNVPAMGNQGQGNALGLRGGDGGAWASIPEYATRTQNTIPVENTRVVSRTLD